MENTRFKLQGSIFSKLASWGINEIEWLTFWNRLQKQDAVGLVNRTKLITKGPITRLTHSGIRLQKIGGDLYVDGQLIGLDWRFTPTTKLIEEVPFATFVDSIPLNQRLPAEVFEFLLKNPVLIPDNWDLVDRNANELDVMFTGSNFACPRGYYVPAITRNSGKWKEIRHFKEGNDIIVRPNMVIAVKQGAHL